MRPSATRPSTTTPTNYPALAHAARPPEWKARVRELGRGTRRGRPGSGLWARPRSAVSARPGRRSRHAARRGRQSASDRFRRSSATHKRAHSGPAIVIGPHVTRFAAGLPAPTPPADDRAAPFRSGRNALGGLGGDAAGIGVSEALIGEVAQAVRVLETVRRFPTVARVCKQRETIEANPFRLEDNGRALP